VLIDRAETVIYNHLKHLEQAVSTIAGCSRA
jgi:hypothetical protein